MQLGGWRPQFPLQVRNFGLYYQIEDDWMSKKQRKPQKKNIFWPLLILAVGAVLVVAGVLYAQQSAQQDEGSPAVGDGTPVIAVSPERIDYGDVKLDTPLTFQIKVTNTGDGTLQIQKEPFLDVVEGC